MERAEALASAGRGGDAAQVYFEAANHASADAALDLRRRAAEELLTAGRIDEGDAILRDVLAAVGISLPRTAFVALLGFLLFRVVLFFRGFGFRATPEGQIAPATLNLDNPSVETKIDLVPHKPRPRKIDTILSNSFGFGGTNASIIMRRFG